MKKLVQVIPLIFLLILVGCKSSNQLQDSSDNAPKTGSLDIKSTPDGAKIFLDGVDSGFVTNATISDLAAGSYVVKLTLDGYRDFEKTYTVTAGQKTTAEKTLEPRAGDIELTTTPSGAEVFLDGADTGKTTPCTLYEVPEGTHKVKFVLWGFFDFIKTVTVADQETVEFVKSLIENLDVTVYITNSGKKYHRDGCQYLSQSKIAISKRDARDQGYTACSRCKPDY